MSQELVLEVHQVSKKFCKNLAAILKYGVIDITKELFNLKTKNYLRPYEFWALKNISFELKRGETLGIIGPNGSGKSTLLKLLNGIFLPDNGFIKIKGKVGTLIEVGAGFHPMLTGRENIYINGTILGMAKKEIDQKFDEIVAFADIGDFLDTPVKNYSSGMYVRLGFAIAVHCQPDILLVDEVLAVGDLAFALKCHRKMSLLRQQGTTVIIVSHNLQAIRNICQKVIWLNHGKIKKYGESYSICDAYETQILKDKSSAEDFEGKILNYDQRIHLTKVNLLNTVVAGKPLHLRIGFDSQRKIIKPIVAVTFFSPENMMLFSNYSHFDGYHFPLISGQGFFDFIIKGSGLKPGAYTLTVSLSENEVSNVLEVHEKFYTFNVIGKTKNYGLINLFPIWKLKN